MIHINRAGSNLGIFSEEDVREGLHSGRFVGTDLGWREGMANWQPLSQFPEFTTGAAASTPSGAIPSQPVSVPGPSFRSGLPWDERQARGFFDAFIETLKMVLTTPGNAFSRMKREGGLGEPLIYGVIGSCIGVIVYWLFVMLLPSAAAFGGNRNPLNHLAGFGVGIFFIILSPLLVALGFFIHAAILHLCLMIVGGAKQPFETTFRVTSFVSGSVGPLMAIPFCGGIVAGVWSIVLQCIGLARAHETDTGRAALAVFLPLIVCCGACFVMVMFFGGMSAWDQH